VRVGIRYKLFLILLSASVLIITTMFIFTRISFEHGLISYMDTMQMKHLETMCQILGENYEQEGSWQFLKDNPEIWDNFQRYTFRKWRRMIRRANSPHHMKEMPMDRNMVYNNNESLAPIPPHRDKGMGMAGDKDKHPSFTLLDRNKELIVGKDDEIMSERLMPVIVNTETVGYLGMSHPTSVIQEEELLFFEGQTRVFLMIAFTMIIISTIVAVWTAFYLEGPIKILTKGTRALACGDYKTRIPVRSKDELGQLSKDFNALACVLEENEADRKKWVEDIAHDLRTPLTLLSGELEAVEDGVRELTPETIERLQADIQHLIRLVNDLNELSRTDKSALAYKKVNTDLTTLIKGVTDRYGEAMKKQGIHMEYMDKSGSPVVVFADPERLKQLFGNIIQNSLDYTYPGGHLRVCIDALGTEARVAIEDSKPGVPDDALPRVFDRLYRVEGSRNRRFGGTGLGLSICRNIVEAHGGLIFASHSPLGGLGIHVTLPLQSRGLV